MRFHFIFSAVIAFVAATMLTKCGNSSVVWEHYDQCALENPSFLAMAECGRRKRLAACEPNNTCSPEGTMFMQYVDSLVLSVKKSNLRKRKLCVVTRNINPVEHRCTRRQRRWSALQR